MRDPAFRRSSKPLPLAAVAELGSASLPPGADATMIVSAVATLGAARAGELAVVGDECALEDLRTTRAGACFVALRHRDEVPAATAALVTDHPMRAFAIVAALIDPGSQRPGLWGDGEIVDRSAVVDAKALVEPGAAIGPGAVIGPGAEIGARTTIGANCVIDAGVRVGRDCAIGPLVTLSHALLGDNVIVHAGARIGVAAPGAPRVGRAILQNAVEVGANAVVARGATGDTVVGEGAVLEASAVVASDTVVPRLARVDRRQS